MEKVVLLNSGGFDSIILYHELKSKGLQVESLFFNYGQRNLEQEKACALRADPNLKEVTLPAFSWSSSVLVDASNKDSSSQYLEFRNLIFLSYALSYAESIGAKSIYVAMLKSHGYKDTSETFLRLFNELSSQCGDIHLIAPYQEYAKPDLFSRAIEYGVIYSDFFSCNVPNSSGKPCGVCPDCVTLIDFYTKIPAHYWIRAKHKPSFAFSSAFMNYPVFEARLLTNNLCNFSCPHCFYGFKEMSDKQISMDRMKQVIADCIDLGIRNFHFSGKEPLVETSIFEYAKHIRSLNKFVTFDVVTNGYFVKKYAETLKELGFSKVYLSVDGYEERSIRKAGSYIYEAIEALQRVGVPLQIFLDLHSGNCANAGQIIRSFHEECGVNDFYARATKPLGGGKTFDLIPTAQDIESAYQSLSSLDFLEDVSLTFYVNQFIFRELADNATIRADWKKYEDYILGSPYPKRLVNLVVELYCSAFESSITITPDGYVLGCATELANPRYAELYGRLSVDELRHAIKIGRQVALRRIKNGEGKFTCYHDEIVLPDQ